jgi:hypothetical protein
VRVNRSGPKSVCASVSGYSSVRWGKWSTARLRCCSNVETIRAMQSHCSGQLSSSKASTKSHRTARIIRSREATGPRSCSFTINLASGNSDLTNSTVPSVQPSAVISYSSGGGFNCCKTQQVRGKSPTRFLVVIITETLTKRRALVICDSLRQQSRRELSNRIRGGGEQGSHMYQSCPR